MAVITFCEDVSAGGEEETDKPEVSLSSQTEKWENLNGTKFSCCL